MVKAFGEFAIQLNFVMYLRLHYELSDIDSNWIYVIWNALAALWGIPLGAAADRNGTRTCLVIGAFINSIGKILLFAQHDILTVAVGVLVVSNVGTELFDKAVQVAISRLLPQKASPDAIEARNTAFQLFYMAENLGAAFSFFYADYAMNGGGTIEDGFHLIVTFSAAASISTVFVSIFYGDGANVPPRRRAALIDGNDIANAGFFKSVKYAFSDRIFWRIVVFELALIGSNVLWNYNSVLFPVFMQIEVGTMHYGSVESLNPILIPLFTVFVGMLTPKTPAYRLVLLGSVLFALSPLPMAVSSTMHAAALSIIIMTVGEAIYSPKVYLVEYNIAPPENAGLYTSLAKIPISFFRTVGMSSSGYLLQWMCNVTVVDKCNEMWVVAIVVAMTTPVLLLVFGKFINLPPVIFFAVGGDDLIDSSDDDDEIRRKFVVIEPVTPAITPHQAID